MSTIKSSDEHLTLNADGASKDIKFQANGVEKASISSAGAFTSTTIDATKLTGALPAIDGSSLTGTGKVLQVVSTASTAEKTSSSTTYADVFSTSITPTSASSKILVLLNLNSCKCWNNDTMLEIKLLRDSTILGYPASNASDTGNANKSAIGSISISYLDSPSTTSAITYKTQFRSAKGGSYARINETYNVASTSTLTLMEIAG